jgi:hypothetical protein
MPYVGAAVGTPAKAAADPIEAVDRPFNVNAKLLFDSLIPGMPKVNPVRRAIYNIAPPINARETAIATYAFRRLLLLELLLLLLLVLS